MIVRFPYIKNGYRDNFSYLACFLSLFKLHNESLNIWSTIASLGVGSLLYSMYFWSHAERRLSLSVFFIGQLVHNPISIGYHLFMPACHDFLRKLDMTAIVFMNLCATWAIINSMSSAHASFATLLVSFLSCKLLAKSWNVSRVDRVKLLYPILASALGYYVPVTIYSLLFSKHWITSVAAPIMYLSHGLGALAYVKHWPQKHWPGRFDYGLHSHVLMHILVFACYNFGYVYLATLDKL